MKTVKYSGMSARLKYINDLVKLKCKKMFVSCLNCEFKFLYLIHVLGLECPCLWS